MRYLALILLVLLPFVAAEEIKLDKFVNDYAGIISDVEEKELDTILKNIYDSGVAQFSIVTVKSLEGKDIESYSLDLAQGKLGDKEKNNGLLLLVSLEDRKYRFEVGRGIEYILNDAKVGRIGRDYLVPNFKEENYGNGIVEASRAVGSILLGDVESQYYVKEENAMNSNYLFLIILIIIIFIRFLKTIEYTKRDKYFDAAAGATILFGRGG
ncbi:MAG: TPM domain-containing protein, partial [Nanoarchaeota archaeon]|nr:TPM domain-containing protein [Nanoarchaeota archaeon]